MNNMQILEALMSNAPPKKSKSKAGLPLKSFKPRNVPLFKVQAILSAPEIVTSPVGPEIYKLMVKLTRALVDSSKQFHRWQHGSCIITPPQKISDDEEPYIFSFHSDIVNNQAIISLISSLNGTMTKSFGGLSKFLDTWRKYRPLWKVDKVN